MQLNFISSNHASVFRNSQGTAAPPSGIIYFLICIEKSFADVQVNDDGVSTHEFLEASDGLVGMFSMSFLLTLWHTCLLFENKICWVLVYSHLSVRT